MNLKQHLWEISKSNSSQIIQWLKLFLFFFIIFTSSSNLFYKFITETAYVNGLLVDYLIPKIYLFELFLAVFLILEIPVLRKLKTQTHICLLLLLIFLRQLLSQTPLASLSHLLHLSGAVLFFISLYADPLFRTKRAKKFGFSAMLITVLFQSLLALYQFISQKSLLAYQFLGETYLSGSANISRGQFFLEERILPYGTTPHPNILAGLVVIFSILLILQSKRQIFTQIALAGNALLIAFLTQSLAALLTLGLFAIYMVLRKITSHKTTIIALLYYVFLLLTPYLLWHVDNRMQADDSVRRRVALNQSALSMFADNTLAGVGLNSFTASVEQYTNERSREVLRFVQPAHHVVLLLLSEGGLLLIALIYLLLQQANIKSLGLKSVPLLAIASLDHYLFTQAVGLLMLALFYFAMADQ